MDERHSDGMGVIHLCTPNNCGKARSLRLFWCQPSTVSNWFLGFFKVCYSADSAKDPGQVDISFLIQEED